MNGRPRFELLFGLGMLIGCSSSTASSGPTGADAGSDAKVVADAEAADTSPLPVDAGHFDASTACNALKSSIQVVSQTAMPVVAPTAAGGATADGVYHATSWTMFTGPGGNTGPTGVTKVSTLELAGSVYQIVSVVTMANVPAGEQRQGGSFTTNNGDIMLVPSCPAAAAKLPFIGYDSDGTTTITLYTGSTGDAGVGVLATTYTKQ